MENRSNGSSWTRHNIATLFHPENCVVLDLDGNGTLEVITGEMRNTNNSTFLIYENNIGWQKNTIDNSHGSPARMNAEDIDGDGDMDIVCDGNGQDHIYLWLNKMGPAAAVDHGFIPHKSLMPARLMVYPNPAVKGTAVSIRLTNADASLPAVLQIFNPLGRIIFFHNSHPVGLHQKVSIHHLPAGHYIINVTKSTAVWNQSINITR
jgi:hypothetical protein